MQFCFHQLFIYLLLSNVLSFLTFFIQDGISTCLNVNGSQDGCALDFQQPKKAVSNLLAAKQIIKYVQNGWMITIRNLSSIYEC